MTNLIPAVSEISVLESMASQANASKMYRNIGDQNAIFMIMLAAREFGISPIMALNGGINIIQGKVEISARMMSAMIRRANHSLKILENTPEVCTIYGKRIDTEDDLKVTYTIEEAKTAGLVKGGGGWSKYPKDMLFARALSRLARQLFSDVIGIAYVEGEIAATPKKEETSEKKESEVVDNVFSVDEFLKLFPENQHKFALEFMEDVKNYYKWTEQETIIQFLKQPERAQKRFLEWQSKKARIDEKFENEINTTHRDNTFDNQLHGN